MKFLFNKTINYYYPFLIISLFLYHGFTFSQTPVLNLQKYWYYRFRLINDFMFVGKGQGKSLLAAQRNIRNISRGCSESHILRWGDTTNEELYPLIFNVGINILWNIQRLKKEQLWLSTYFNKKEYFVKLKKKPE